MRSFGSFFGSLTIGHLVNDITKISQWNFRAVPLGTVVGIKPRYAAVTSELEILVGPRKVADDFR